MMHAQQSAVNQDAFLEVTHVPVQLFRAACAVTIAVGVGFLLKVFHLETMKRLRDSESRFRGMADNAPDGVIEIDGNGAIAFWNPAAQRLFGHSADRVLGRKLLDVLIPERFRTSFLAACPQLEATGRGMTPGRPIV